MTLLWIGTVNKIELNYTPEPYVPLTIYPHILREIRGYTVILEEAAYTQSH